MANLLSNPTLYYIQGDGVSTTASINIGWVPDSVFLVAQYSFYVQGTAPVLIPVANVIGVEVVEEAVADATMNARINGIKNCQFEAGDVADLLDDLAGDRLHVDVAVLNPPRKGCDQNVLERVAALGPKSILYVSCSPQSLARDLDMIRY